MASIETKLTASGLSKPPEPFTSWDQVPLVCSLEMTAQVLNTSASSIHRALKAGTMQPRPMPRIAGGKWQWSKAVLQKYVDGGYQQMAVRNRRGTSSDRTKARANEP